MDDIEEMLDGVMSQENNYEEQKTESIRRLLKTLPESQQIEVLELAQALNVTAGDDIIYSIMVGLGYHKTYLKGVPDQISAAGTEAKQAFEFAARKAEESLNMSTESVMRRLRELFNSAGAGVEISARNGAKEAIEHADLSNILEQIKNQAVNSAENQWLKHGIWITAAAACLIIITSFSAGWFIKKAFPEQHYVDSEFFMSQLKCSASGKYKMLECADQLNNKVWFKWPEPKK